MGIKDKILNLVLSRSDFENIKNNGYNHIYRKCILWKKRIGLWGYKYDKVRVYSCDKESLIFPIKSISVVKGHDVGFRFNIDYYDIEIER